ASTNRSGTQSPAGTLPPEPTIETGSTAGHRTGRFTEFLRTAAAGSRAQHRTRPGRAPGMESARIANQSRRVPEKSVAGFATTLPAVRWRFHLLWNVGKHGAADVHLPGQREYAAVHRWADSRGGCSR